MATSKQQKEEDYQDHEEEEEEEDYSDSDCDLDIDPSYSILEETRGKLSNLDIKKKSNSRFANDMDLGIDKDPEEMEVNVAEVDDKSFEKVQMIIQAGKLEKLKVEQCKVYLRRKGLRLTGNKDTLIQRIKEHQEILKGGGEKKYPMSSFVLNCKGDACIGDVVLFEQNVYEMYNIASRSASGPPCGTRIVAGRILKESYGAAKQQHSFTIEVLWSKGEKPLPPLHPLLIKGRNLYRLKTLRQRWEDETARCKVLMEKHSRGSLARSDRETRIQRKEKRKMLREIRALKEEPNRNLSQLNPTLKVKLGIQPQKLDSFINLGKIAIQTHESGLHINVAKSTIQAKKLGMSTDEVKMGEENQQPTIQSQQSDLLVDSVKPTDQPPQDLAFAVRSRKLSTQPELQKRHREIGNHKRVPCKSIKSDGTQEAQQHKLKLQSDQQEGHRENGNHKQVPHKAVKYGGTQRGQQHSSDDFAARQPNLYMNDHHSGFIKHPCTTWENELAERNYHGQPLTSMNHNHRKPLTGKNHYHRPMSPNRQPSTSINHCHPMSPPHGQGYQQQQPCKYYAQGRCYYGDNCKFLHETGDICG